MKKVRRTENVPIRIKEFLQEYKYDDDIFCPDSEKVRALKKIVSELPDVDRIVLLLYVELQSLSEVAKILQISRSSVFWEIKRIKKQVLDKYNEVLGLHSHMS